MQIVNAAARVVSLGSSKIPSYVVPQAKGDEQQLPTLTEKQAEVMRLVYQGYASKEIARMLNISPATVDQRADGARKKLNAATRTEAARKFVTHEGISEQFIYQPVPLTKINAEPASTESLRDELQFEDSLTFDERATWDRSSTWRLPALEPGDLGPIGRIAVILAMTVFILLVIGEGLRLAASLGEFFR